MAEFKDGNLKLKTGQSILFGDSSSLDEAPYTKDEIDSVITTVSGSIPDSNDIEGVVNQSRTWQYTQEFDNEILSITSEAADWDLSTKQIVSITLTDDVTISGTNIPSGLAHFTLLVKQNGSYTVSWSNQFKWASGEAPTITTTSGSVDIISFVSDGYYLYGSFGQNYS